MNDAQKFLKLKEATEVIKVKLETVRAGKISEAVDNIADEALQSIAQQVKSSQTAVLDIELNQIDQKLYIYSPRPTGPGKGGFENIATLEKRDNTDFLIIKDNEFYPTDQFPNFSGTKIQADHIISSRGEYLENVELVTKEDGTIVFRAAVDGIRNQLKAIGASDELIARIKSIDQAQLLTDDILSKRELLDFFEGRVNGVETWEAAINGEIPKSIRTNRNDLDFFSKHLSGTGKPPEELAIQIKGKTVLRLRSWIDGIIDWNTLRWQEALDHVKFRDFSVPRNKGIGGCHNADEWAKESVVRKVLYKNGYKVQSGKLVSEVEEVIIFSDLPHPSVSGVRILEYKIPAIDGSHTNAAGIGDGYTTGSFKQ